MTADVVIGGRLLLGQQLVKGFVEIVDGRIDRVREGRPPSSARTAPIVSPGFVDIHVHGGGGASFQTGDAEQIDRVITSHRRHGTTTVLASLVSDSIDSLVDAMSALSVRVDGRSLAGIHLEGPFLASGRCGAHDPRQLQRPTRELIERLIDAAAGTLRMMTLAPELPGALDLIELLDRAGVVAAIGHTDARYDDTVAAIDAGARVATHLFNAMRALAHREPGPVVPLLADPTVVVELIADGVHLHPSVIQHVFAVAGADRVALITDAMAASGAPDGSYRLGSLDVHVVDRVARVAGTDTIAGSTLTMDSAIRHCVAVGIHPADALHAATAVPARAVGLGERVGELVIGRPADLVLLDADMNVIDVLVDGDAIAPAEVTA